MSGANHWATKNHATQPATDNTSKTRPRHAPIAIDASSTTAKIQSSDAMVSNGETAGSYSVNTEADNPSPLMRLAALSASARLVRGPTRTRTRFPSLVSTTWV